MTEPFLRKFSLPDGSELTSVVLDQDEFDELCDSLKDVMIYNMKGQRAAEAHLKALKTAKHLPLMSRGTKTQFVFDKYGIETDKASFIVRGHGRSLAKDFTGSN